MGEKTAGMAPSEGGGKSPAGGNWGPHEVMSMGQQGQTPAGFDGQRSAHVVQELLG